MEVNDLVDMLIMIGMIVFIICENAGSVLGKNLLHFPSRHICENSYILFSVIVCFIHYFKVVLMQIRGTLLICLEISTDLRKAMLKHVSYDVKGL